MGPSDGLLGHLVEFRIEAGEAYGKRFSAVSTMLKIKRRSVNENIAIPRSFLADGV